MQKKSIFQKLEYFALEPLQMITWNRCKSKLKSPYIIQHSFEFRKLMKLPWAISFSDWICTYNFANDNLSYNVIEIRKRHNGSPPSDTDVCQNNRHLQRSTVAYIFSKYGNKLTLQPPMKANSSDTAAHCRPTNCKELGPSWESVSFGATQDLLYI
jgi:hypothetical protein